MCKQDADIGVRSDVTSSCARSQKKRSSEGSGRGGTWAWRVQLRKRAVLRSRSRQTAAVCPDHGGSVMDGVREPRIVASAQRLHVHKRCAESKCCASYRWWSACKSYERAVMQCRDRDELLTLKVQFDRPVVNWYALGCSGLGARSVGGSRVCIRRVSPGCGVHRRKKHGVRCAERLATCAQHCREACLSEDGRAACGLPVCLEVADCGSRWRGRKAKCLQA